jgi:hypothetical protein
MRRIPYIQRCCCCFFFRLPMTAETAMFMSVSCIGVRLYGVESNVGTSVLHSHPSTFVPPLLSYLPYLLYLLFRIHIFSAQCVARRNGPLSSSLASLEGSWYSAKAVGSRCLASRRGRSFGAHSRPPRERRSFVWTGIQKAIPVSNSGTSTTSRQVTSRV